MTGYEVLRFDLERDDLCDRFGGGLPRGSVILVEAEHGGGKSILTQRLVYGLLEHGHEVSYISTELTTSSFLGQMKSLEFGVDHHLAEDRLVFIPVYPVLGARAPRHDLLRRLVKARLMYTKDVIVFDTLSKFLVDHLRAAGNGFAAVEQIEAVQYLFKRLTSVGKTIIITIEKGQAPEEIVAVFKESADLYLAIQLELVGNTVNRRIVVHRMSRAQGRFGDVIGFRVEAGLGIVIEIRSVV